MYLRGLGIGIIVTAIILIIARNTGNKMSDKEIIKRAEELGMVMKETESDKLFPDNETQSTEESTTEVSTKEPQTTEAPTTEAPTTEAPTTEAPTTEAPTTETPTEPPTTEAPTQPPTEKPTMPPDTTVVTAKIVVTKGMFSEAISQAMERTGVISDWRKFNDYLEANGYAERLQTGTFTLKSTMSFEEMAKILTSR
jgi:hypothetical protein